MDLPSLESLRCFVAACEHLNFRLASQEMHLTPAAFGQRIKGLEEQYDVELFQRTTRSVRMTPEATRLLPIAKSTLRKAFDFAQSSMDESQSLAADITIGTRHELGLSWLLPLRKKLLRMLPHVTVHLYFGFGDDLLDRVERRQLDCAITSTRITSPHLLFEPIHDEEYVFVAAASLLKAQPITRPKDVKGHTLIDIDKTLPLFRYFRDARGGFDVGDFDNVLRAGTIAAIRSMTLSGEGVSVLPRYFVQGDLKNKRLTQIFPKIELNSDAFRLVYRRDSVYTELIKTLAEHMQNFPLK